MYFFLINAVPLLWAMAAVQNVLPSVESLLLL